MELATRWRRPLALALPIAALVCFAAPASAQVVNVDLRNAKILNNVARDLEVNIRDVPITVQVPINVAANVCGVTANILSNAYTAGPSATCSAQQSTQALTNTVRRVMGLQN